MPAAPHPTPDELRDFLLGKLPDRTSDTIATHLDLCDECSTVIDGLDTGDTLQSQLRTPPVTDPLLAESQLRRALDFVKQVGQTIAPAAAAGPSQPLEMIREYELLALLGEGGMGTVYLARHTRLDKQVALKLLPRDRTQDAAAVARFAREMRAVGKLDHPNIVRAMDAGEHDGRHYLVMEHVQGIDLSQLIRQLGTLPIADACELVRQAAVGLTHAHQHGLVHRDIKPSNLMLTTAGQVKILDLGLALLGEQPGDVRELTNSGQMMGTLDYMAPEQGGDSHLVDIRADLYSLGATLYKLLTGEAPFTGEKYRTPVQKLLALSTEPVPPIESRRSDLPAQLTAIVAKLLAKSPDQRYATPAELVTALAPLAIGANLPQLVATATGNKAASSTAEIATHPSVMSGSVGTSPGNKVQLPESSTVSQFTGGKSGRYRWAMLSTAAGFLAVVALGAILTLRTPKGEIVIELGEGVEAQTVAISVQQGGQEVTVADAAHGWEIKVKEGKYDVALKESDDMVRLEQSEVTVKRGDRAVVRVTLRDAAEVASVEPVTTRVVEVQPTPGKSGSQEPSPAIPPRPAETLKPPLPKPTVTDAQLAERLAAIDWKPGEPVSYLRGLVAQPAAIPGLPAWQLQHAVPHLGARNLLSPQGNYVATHPARYVATLQIREALTGRIVGIVPFIGGGATMTDSCAWSPDELYFAQTNGSEVRVFRRDGLATAHWKFSMKRSRLGTSGLTWSPDGTRIMYRHDAAWMQWTPLGQRIGSFTNPPAQVNGYMVKWSPDGKHFIAYHVNRLHLLTADGGAPLASFEFEKGSLNGWSWHPNGDRFAVSTSGDTADYNLRGEKQRSIPRPSGKESIRAWSPDGSDQLWSNGQIRTSAGTVKATIDPAHYGDRVWSKDNRIVILHPYNDWIGRVTEYAPNGGKTREFKPVAPVSLYLHSWLSQEDRLVTAAVARGHADSAAAFHFDWQPDGQGQSRSLPAAAGTPQWDESRQAYSCIEYDLRVFDKHGQPIPLLHDIAVRGSSHSWSHSGKRLAVRSENRLGIWEGAVRIVDHPLPPRHAIETAELDQLSLEWSPSERYVVHRIFGDLHDLQNPDQPPLKLPVKSRYGATAWHPAEDWLAVPEKDAIRVITPDGTTQHTIALAKNKLLNDPLWHPDGKRILVGGTLYELDGKVSLIYRDADFGQPVWFDAGRKLAIVQFQTPDQSPRLLIWNDPQSPPAIVPLVVGPLRLSNAAGGRPLSAAGRYLTITTNVLGGDVLVVDLEAQKLAWLGVGYSDGERLVISPAGELKIFPKSNIDDYVRYVIAYPQGRRLALTQRQFAARIGLSPAQQAVQQVLDVGGRIQIRGHQGWITADDLLDARHLPAPEEVVAIEMGEGLRLSVTNELAQSLILLPNLARLDLEICAIDDATFSRLKDHAGLRDLNLAGTRVPGSVCRLLPPGLETLDLSRTPLDDLHLAALPGLKSLKRVVAIDTKITPQGIAEFRAKRPDCELLVDDQTAAHPVPDSK